METMQNIADKPEWAAHFDGDAPLTFDFEAKAIHSYLDAAADKYPSRKAVIFQNLTLTYKQVRDKAEAMAASFLDHGMKRGDRVAIMLPNVPQTIISIWAVLKAGGIVVMTNPLYMEKELTHHFHDSRATFLITLDLFWSKVENLYKSTGIEKCFISTLADSVGFPLNYLYPIKAKHEGSLIKIPYDNTHVFPWKSLLKTSKRYNEYPEDPSTTVALLQYTGGTTGFSKAAMLTHGNLSIHMQQLFYVTHCDDTMDNLSVGVMPFFHVFGLVGTIFLPAYFACATLPVPRYVPRDILELIKKFRPTLFVGAPSVYIGLVQQKDIKNYDLTCIKLCICGASPFPADSFRKFQDITQANITEGLGLTECSPCVTANPVFGTKKTGSVGVPFPGTSVRIVDIDTGTQELAEHQMGEVIVRGPQVMLGYWERPEETAMVMRDGWFYTGDIAYKDEDGYYFIVDRKKDMAIIGGYNVYPREIDEVLYEHPKIQDAVALSVPHRSRGETLKAYIVTKPGEKLTVPELVAYCRQKLATYKVPRSFEFRDELPKTLIGKVLRRALREEEIEKMKEKENNTDIEKPERPLDEGMSVEIITETKQTNITKKEED